MSSAASRGGPATGRLIKLMSLFWLAGVAMRMTILAMPPVIPLVHAELHLSETQVGLLVGLPLALFALAAVPGSLLIAQIGASFAAILGMVIAALAGGARAAAIDVWTLYAAVIATGFGVAIMQPAMPTLVRKWMPGRIGFGTVTYTSGMLMGATFPPILTIPFVLRLAGGSWRINLLLWAVPALLIPPLFFVLRPNENESKTAPTTGGRWWPDWKNPLIWILGMTLGANNSAYFTTSAFLGDYLASIGKPELLSAALSWLNGTQLLSLVALFVMADYMQRRAWPYLVFGPILLAAFLGMIFVPTVNGIIVACALIGFTTAITLAATLAIPALIGAPADVPRTSAAMFTISYACAVIVPTISGALWDTTGKPWSAFVPLCICAVALTILGVVVTRYRPSGDSQTV
jgi:MFS transporter, CP family, cyanate transporter